MRRFIKLWILLILLPTGLLAPRAPKPEKKHYPPLREDWLTDPALKRELKRGF